ACLEVAYELRVQVEPIAIASPEAAAKAPETADHAVEETLAVILKAITKGGRRWWWWCTAGYERAEQLAHRLVGIAAQDGWTGAVRAPKQWASIIDVDRSCACRQDDGWAHARVRAQARACDVVERGRAAVARGVWHTTAQHRDPRGNMPVAPCRAAHDIV